jgi:hypothetical protein
VISQLPVDEQLDSFHEVLSRNEVLTEVLSRSASLGLPGWYLMAGCLFQTLWNAVTSRARAVKGPIRRSGRSTSAGIRTGALTRDLQNGNGRDRPGPAAAWKGVESARADPRAAAAAGLPASACALAVRARNPPGGRRVDVVTPGRGWSAPRVDGAHWARRCRSSKPGNRALRASWSDGTRVVAVGVARGDVPGHGGRARVRYRRDHHGKDHGHHHRQDLDQRHRRDHGHPYHRRDSGPRDPHHHGDRHPHADHRVRNLRREDHRHPGDRHEALGPVRWRVRGGGG